jgi:hypothetical protein
MASRKTARRDALGGFFILEVRLALHTGGQVGTGQRQKEKISPG